MRLRLPFLTILTLFTLSSFAQKAPDFKVSTTDGNSISLYADYLDKGQSVVIELFFVDCPPCNNLAPYMADLHTELKVENVNVEFISFSDKNWDNTETVVGFKERYNHDWPFVSPEGGSLEAVEVYENGTYGQFWGTPTTIVIAPDGTVNYNVRGSIGTNWTDNLKAAIIESQTALNEAELPMTTLNGQIGRADNQGIGGVTLNFKGGKDTTIVTNADGGFATGSLLTEEAYTINVSKETNPGNGVTTLDIVLITKHILGIDMFTQPTQMVAADVNLSGTVTTLDIVRLRQLILGINDVFPEAPSWVFEPSEVSLENLSDLDILLFTGTKIGDVNNSADPAELLSAEPRNSVGKFSMVVKDKLVEKGEIYEVAFLAKDLQNTLGFQFTLDFDIEALQLIDLQEINIANFSKDNINLTQKDRGLVTTSWANLTPQKGTELFKLQFKAEKEGYLSEFLKVNSRLTKAEAYTFDNDLLDIDLSFEKEEIPTIEVVELYPNPVGTEMLNLSFVLNETEVITVNLMDLSGKEISQQKYHLTKGNQQLELSTAQLESGIYLVQILKGEELMQALKFVKK